MPYSRNKYQLTHLLQEAWQRLGQMRIWKATGGSTTTVINTDWALSEEPTFEDDDPTLILGSVVVVAADGTAPEGEYAVITDYDSGSSTITNKALSAAVAANDLVGVVSPLFPITDMVNLANIALRTRIGKLDLIDTSLTVSAGQTQYTMPIRVAPKRVRVYKSNNASIPEAEILQGWKVIPQTAGSNWILEIPEIASGYTIELLYEDLHPYLDSYADDIREEIHPELALNAMLAEAVQWYNNSVGGSNQYFLQRENKFIQDFEAARVRWPITREVGQVQGLPHWHRRADYVPLTSDLRR